MKLTSMANNKIREKWKLLVAQCDEVRGCAYSVRLATNEMEPFNDFIEALDNALHDYYEVTFHQNKD